MTTQSERTAKRLSDHIAKAAEAAAEAKKDAPKPEWKPVPEAPFIEAHQDGRLRRVSPLPAAGMVDAQSEGRRVRASAATLHHAAWPELWPGHLERPRVVVEDAPARAPRPRRPFHGIDRAPLTTEPVEWLPPDPPAEAEPPPPEPAPEEARPKFSFKALNEAGQRKRE